MHEAYIALSILDMAGEQCRKAGRSRVESIDVRIGSASGVLPDALQFAFDVARIGTIAEGALLNIEEIPLGGICMTCGEGYTSREAFVISCPNCGSPNIALDKGRELHITGLEVT